MQAHPTTAAILLAAGSSSRMGHGRHKLLLPLGNRPVVAHVLEATLASQAFPTVLVLGHQAEQVRFRIDTYTAHPSLSIVENPDYRQGMSTSLRAGLQHLLQEHHSNEPVSSTLDSVLILLADQPLITSSIIDMLITTRKTTGKNIIAPLYKGKRGNPILFAASLFPELIEVTGDEGGRSVIERHKQDMATVEVGDVGTSYDVDTWETYQQVVELWHNTQEKPERE